MVKIGPNVVVQVKSEDKNGYAAVQLGSGSKKVKNISKPELAHLKGAINKDCLAPRFLREVRVTEGSHKVGDKVSASDILSPGDLVQVQGVSKGKGFAGVVKRWGFSGGPKTHGQSDRWRAPGSIGLGTTPGRVFKGKKMAGHMGVDTVSVRNLMVLKVNESGEVWLSGPVPGNRGGLLRISKVGEKKNFIGLPEKDTPEETSIQSPETAVTNKDQTPKEENASQE